MIIPKYFTSNAHPITVTLIGLGGTGSTLLTHLGRIHVSLKAKGLQGLLVTCVDDDIVTDANMGRQLFTENDLGRNKAVALTERINRFFGTSWMAIPEKFTLKITNIDNFPGNIVISCVDNVTTRHRIHDYLFNANMKGYKEEIANHYWMDTGNSMDIGQIILGSFKHKLQTVIDLYPDMRKHEKKDKTPSCSLAEALDKQDLFINTMVANVAGQLMWDLCLKPVVDWSGAYININKQRPITKIKA